MPPSASAESLGELFHPALAGTNVGRRRRARRVLRVADLEVDVTVDEPAAGDVVVDGGVVLVRAFRDDQGDGRLNRVTASVTDVAGNLTTESGDCVVPHDRRP